MTHLQLLKAASKAIAPPQRLLPSEWAVQNFRLSPEASAEPGNYHWNRAPYQREMLDAIAHPDTKEVVFMTSAQVGKALDIYTPIATVDGWKTMEEIAIGDIVFDEKGNPCNVIGLSEIYTGRECYAVKFSDNSVIFADADHRWVVEEYNWGELVGIATLTTYQMSLNFKKGKRNRYAIPVAEPLNLPEKKLLIPPYLLGLWLGDGHSNASSITCHKKDYPFYENAFVKEGYHVLLRGEKDKNTVRLLIDPRQGRQKCVRGHYLPDGGVCPECAKVWYKNSNLKKRGKEKQFFQPAPAVFGRQLIALGVRGLSDRLKQKSIPQDYLRGSYQQRLDLLCGLMDTDGYISAKTGRSEFVTTSAAIADGFAELLSGLGIKFTMAEKQPVTTYKGEKVCGKKAYRFSFLVYSDTPIFKLPRKLNLLPSRDGRRTSETEKRRIVDIFPIESRPVKCIAVDSPSHLYLAGKTMIPTHNTTLQLITVGYFIDLNPCPMLWVAPTLEMAESTSKERLAPMFRDSPCFKGKISDPRSRDSGNTLLSKKFPGGVLTLAGANSPASLASRPIQTVLIDEADRFPLSAGTEGDPIALAKKRTTTFWNRMVITVSTPTVKGVSRIEKAWELSDQRRYYVPCPHCGFEQPLAWDNLRYQGKGELDRPSNIPDVLYFCGACGAGIEEHHKAKMLAAGYWQAGRESGGIVGFHLNELYSPWKSWHDVALDFEAAKSDPMQFQVWVNTSLGEPFEPDTRTRYDWENLLYRSEESEYSQGSVPAGVLFMTAGVDVQGDRLEVGIFGWGEGEECWLIGHYQVFGVPTDSATWEKTEGLLNAQFDHPLGGKVSVSRVFVDTGFETHEVYGQVRQRRNWFAVKGVAGDRPIVGKPSLQEVNWRGERIKKGIKLYTVGIDKVKEVLLSRCRIDKPGPKYLNLPQDAGRFWCQGFAGSEVRMQKHRNGHPYYVWETVQGVRNEPLDCAVYAFAAAIQAGINRPNFFKGRREVLTVEKGVKAEVMEVQGEVKAPEKAKKRQRRGSYLNGFGR